MRELSALQSFHMNTKGPIRMKEPKMFQPQKEPALKPLEGPRLPILLQILCHHTRPKIPSVRGEMKSATAQ